MSVDVETAREWLQRYSDLQAEITILIDRSEALRAKASSPGSPKIDGMPHNPSSETSRMANLMALCLDLERETREKIQKSQLLYQEIDGVIRKIKGRGSSEMHIVLQTRYLDRFEWNEILEIMFLRKRDFLEKEDSYTRRMFRIHQTALSAIAKLIDENEVQEIDTI